MGTRFGGLGNGGERWANIKSDEEGSKKLIRGDMRSVNGEKRN
jgi:hypothetical protein